MSEKRFIVENDNNEVSIKDKVKDNYPFALAYEHIDDGDNLIQECLSLVVLLNEQQTEIDDLKEENRQLRQFINKNRRLSVKELMDNANENELLKKKIKGLEKENEQLKQSNDRFADTVAKQVSLLIELRKENEQLKQIIKDIVCATDETYTKNTSMFKVTVVFDYEKYREIKECLYE